jgi:hypothetical protein
MLSVFLVAGLGFWKQNMLPRAELISVPASVASTSLVRRIQLTMALSLTITAHYLVNWQKARGGENENERSKQCRSLLNSKQHCAGPPRRSPRNHQHLAGEAKENLTLFALPSYRCTIFSIEIGALPVPKGPRGSL